jgi:UDP-glucose 4-epimerase
MKNCLITGGCGFIGRHFTKKMSELGYEIDIVDDLSSNSSLMPEMWAKHLKCKFNFYKENMLDFFLKTSKSYNIIIHAGAIVGGRETIENDPLLISRNITTDSELFRWIEKNPVEYLVYFSSSAVYPIKLQTLENHRKLKMSDVDIEKGVIDIPDLTYGWSKLTGEFELNILSKRVNTNISVYRPFSGYGEDQHDSYPFPSIMKKILSSKNKEIELWSDAVRDFIYIDDIVNFVSNTCFHNKKIQILNIGTSIATSMTELSYMIAKIADKNIKVCITENKPKGVYYRVSDDCINYPITSLENGIRKCIALSKTFLGING